MSPRNEVDPNKTARVLANLQRVTAPADAPPAAPVVIAAPIEPVVRSVEPAEGQGASMRSISDAPVDTESRSVTESRPTSDSRGGADPRTNNERSSRRPRASIGAETISERPFEVSTGKGIKMLNVRVPKELHARLLLIATRNKLADNGGPQTITDLAIEALKEVVDRSEAA